MKIYKSKILKIRGAKFYFFIFHISHIFKISYVLKIFTNTKFYTFCNYLSNFIPIFDVNIILKTYENFIMYEK
jgi:hypothetical protein